MGLFDRFREPGEPATQLDERDIELLRREAQLEVFQERIAELELDEEAQGWYRVDAAGTLEFSRQGLDRIVRQARLMYLKNPIIHHAVELQAHYVFGQSINISATSELVNDVVQAFMDDPGNRAELTSDHAMLQKERELTLAGNLFLVLFPDLATGAVRVRSIPFEQLREIICNPEDIREPWYYKRIWQQPVLDVNSGNINYRQVEAFYPDWRYTPRVKPTQMGGKEVRWQSPVYHVRAGGLDHNTFGIPEIYSALDWARAAKEFLEDVATLIRAQSRFAAKVVMPGGARGVAAAKSKMGTTITTGQIETNPPPTAGSTLVTGQGVDYSLIRASGNAPAYEEGRGFALMAAAGAGIPETMLMGDASKGNLATAKTLDRPTELKMGARQTFWESIIEDLLGYVIESSATAVKGDLRPYATTTVQPNGDRIERVVTWKPDPSAKPDPRNPDKFDENAPLDPHLDIDFPSILESNQLESVQAWVAAAGTGALPPDMVARGLMAMLGIDDIDEEMESVMGFLANKQAQADTLQQQLAQTPAMDDGQDKTANTQTGGPVVTQPSEESLDARLLLAIGELREAVRREKAGAL